MLTATECSSNNGTKATPCLSADILGDWREEVIWRTSDNTALHIYTTTTPATNRFYTLMHDPQYRLAIAWQNVAYNQPPHPGFYLGDGMATPPVPPVSDANLVWRGGDGGNLWDVASTTNWLVGGVWTNTIASDNFLVWWDADVIRELLDSNHIDKYGTISDTRLLTASECSSNNGTKSTPCLSADILGDWREEVIWRVSATNNEIRIYTTTTPATNRFYTLMHDPQYREAIAWQNVAYNQPPHPGFYLG